MLWHMMWLCISVGRHGSLVANASEEFVRQGLAGADTIFGVKD